MKQISLTIPEKLYVESKKYCDEFGFKNVQEFILDSMREKVLSEDHVRTQRIFERMKKGKGVTTMTKEEFLAYLDKMRK